MVQVARLVSAGQQPVIIAVGMYRLETLERLSISDENGQHLADDQIILKGVVSVLEGDDQAYAGD